MPWRPTSRPWPPGCGSPSSGAPSARATCVTSSASSRKARVDPVSPIDLTTIPALADVEPVKSTKTPLHLDYLYTAGIAQTRFLLGTKQKKLLGQRCPKCG